MSDPQQYPASGQYGTPASPPPYGQQPTPPATDSPVGDNPLGKAAFLVAVIAVGISILTSLLRPILIASGNYDVANSLVTAVGLLTTLGSIGAIVLSIVALRRPAPHLLAAIALGISGSAVASGLVGGVGAALLYAF